MPAAWPDAARSPTSKASSSPVSRPGSSGALSSSTSCPPGTASCGSCWTGSSPVGGSGHRRHARSGAVRDPARALRAGPGDRAARGPRAEPLPHLGGRGRGRAGVRRAEGDPGAAGRRRPLRRNRGVPEHPPHGDGTSRHGGRGARSGRCGSEGSERGRRAVRRDRTANAEDEPGGALAITTRGPQDRRAAERPVPDRGCDDSHSRVIL